MQHPLQVPQQTTRELPFCSGEFPRRASPRLHVTPLTPQVCLFCTQVIVERYVREKTLPLLDKTKFLVPFELTLGQFLCLLR